LPKAIAVAAYHHGFEAARRQFHLGRFRHGLKHLQGTEDNRVPAYHPRFKAKSAGVSLGQHQQLIDQNAHLTAFLQQDRQHFLVFLNRTVGVEGDFQRTLQGGQG